MLSLPRFLIRWATWPVRFAVWSVVRVLLRAFGVY